MLNVAARSPARQFSSTGRAKNGHPCVTARSIDSMAASDDALRKYREKRSADRTPEPFGQGEGAPGLFVFHQHAASHLHFDLRLELDGTLMSWAVPKGPSLDPKEKRFAVRVEDHPVEYGAFEGLIPKGNYGAGAVILWDRGQWIPKGDPHVGLEKGDLKFELRGYKLKGEWVLVRTQRNPKEWLLIKHRDEWADPDGKKPPPQQSVLSGLTVEQLRDHVDRADEVRKRLESLGAPKKKVTDAKPMLCQPIEEPFSDPGWVYELKYDGYRLFASRDSKGVHLKFRRGDDATGVFPDVAAGLEKLPFNDALIDGEVVVLDGEGRPDFGLLQQRAQLRKASEVRHTMVRLPATLMAFDLLGLEGYDLRSLQLIERKKLLREILPPAGPVAYSDHIERHGDALFQEVSKRGLEGLVAKKADSVYRAGRSANWKKLALGRRAELAVVGWTVPEGARSGFGALHLATHVDGTLTYAGKVGTGFSESDITKILEVLKPLERDTPAFEGTPIGRDSHFVEPKMVVEVRYKEWTADGSLRHPVFLRVRVDKTPADCEREELVRDDALPAPVEAPEPPPKPAAVVAPTPPPPPTAPEPRDFTLSNLDKVFWPDEGYTKGDLIEYYETIAPWILPYLRDRPLMLTRYPDGIGGKSFFQKDAPSFVPKWLRRVHMWSEDRQAEVEQFVCDDVDSLVYLANLGTIPLHIWSSRVSALQHPDWCVIDLDPKGAPFAHVVRVAKTVQGLCDDIGLPSFPKTTGSSGLHVFIPLGMQLTHAQSKSLAELLARVVVQRVPDIATIARPIADRGGRVYVDFGQNGQGKLIAGPFCVRPVPGAQVSMPLHWGEVNLHLHPSQFTMKNAAARMQVLGEDPLRAVLSVRPDIGAALGRLASKVER